jgi:hypothetical protein
MKREPFGALFLILKTNLMKSMLDIKRATRFVCYKSELQKKRTHNRKRSYFSKLKRACDSLQDKRMLEVSYPWMKLFNQG